MPCLRIHAQGKPRLTAERLVNVNPTLIRSSEIQCVCIMFKFICYLHASATGEDPLTWLQRLQIALDSAHGKYFRVYIVFLNQGPWYVFYA